jgi:hypothetical protein
MPVWTRASLSAHAISTPVASHPLGLLRARRERPRCCRATEQRDELTSLYVEHGDFLPYAY